MGENREKAEEDRWDGWRQIGFREDWKEVQTSSYRIRKSQGCNYSIREYDQ